MERELIDHLHTVAAAYAQAKGLKESTVGKDVAGDGRFFANLRSGITFTARKYDRVMRRFSENWPDGLDWPADIPRPAVQPEAAE